ncbi:site-specific integrase [Tardiphaga robiniae]|uniref:site-specific integrase n=1 Tax=Tardiphaga robiniae TaxID=943830 RepID=UPI001FCCE92D|nr:site-specific integrase [Tardiphaga robiniae]
MSDSPLTRDNLLLSRTILDSEGLKVAARFAINCTSDIQFTVADCIRDSLSENTRAAYLSDLLHFEKWGGTIPATSDTIAAYLAAHVSLNTPATLTRRLAALAKVHRSLGFSNPTSAEVVKATMRGIRRMRGLAQRQATPLVKEDLFVVLESMGVRLKDYRDRALLLLGFAGGLRRSELVGLDWEDLVSVRQGLEITLRRSKTDQNGMGRKIGIPYGKGRWCPVVTVEQWRVSTTQKEGAVFRSIDRHQRISELRLSGEAVCLVVRERVKAAGIDAKSYSGHSLRAGLATSAAQARVPSWIIRQQTGHNSDAMLNRYIRQGSLFLDNASGALL